MLHLDIAQLQRGGYLRGNPTEARWLSSDREPRAIISILPVANGLRLLYRTRAGDGDWQAVDELVPVVTTPTQFGGRRQWFKCLNCGRRCRILYGGGRFRCRRCHRLRYGSQAETKADRATRAMFKIVKRLNPEQPYNDLPAKPRHMHWRTYEQLIERYEYYDEQWALEAM